jgi:hypothetical protein
VHFSKCREPADPLEGIVKKNHEEPETGDRRVSSPGPVGPSSKRRRTDEMGRLDRPRDWLETDPHRRRASNVRHVLATAGMTLLVVAGAAALVYFLVWKPMADGQGPFAHVLDWLIATGAPTPTGSPTP